MSPDLLMHLSLSHSVYAYTQDKQKTKVGAKGGKLSGGQKQRVAIARLPPYFSCVCFFPIVLKAFVLYKFLSNRALVRKPKILLLDEVRPSLTGPLKTDKQP